MTMAKKLPLLAPSIHTFEVNGTYTDCEAKRTIFMAIQKMVSAEKYYRVPYHGSSKKGYSYKRKDGGLTITLAEYPDFRKRYITLSGVNLARIAGDPSRLSLTDLSPEGLAMQEQAFLNVPCSFCPLLQRFFYIEVNPSFLCPPESAAYIYNRYSGQVQSISCTRHRQVCRQRSCNGCG